MISTAGLATIGCRKVAVIAAALAVASVGIAESAESTARGFSKAGLAAQAELEAAMAAQLSSARIEDHLRWLTSRPHLAGSRETRLTAEYLHQQLVEYGLRTETTEYDAFLPAPLEIEVELIVPERRVLATTEEPIGEDPFSQRAAEFPGWSGYSPSGEVVGQVVYGGYGSEKELSLLRQKSVDLAGKILLLRNFGTGEGRKVRNAELFGAAGVLLYTDPAEDGYPFGDVYPHGNWRPAASIMRRSILFLPYDGDPLSPGWASRPGARRLSPDQVALPKIPVTPVSYGTAEVILRALRGPVAPQAWQGALPVTYRLGPGPAEVRLRTKMDNRDRPILNVVGVLEGAVEPDQWIIISNHHDAWIYGAGDPSSGTAALLELARSLGELAKQGHRPRRTIVVGFWDAEEMAYTGSTEWVEEHAVELLEKAVACVNMDSAVFNTDRPLSVAAHPLLHALFREVSRDLRDPRTGKSGFDAWRDLQNEYRQVPGVDGWGEFFDASRELEQPWIFEIPYDDAAPFYHQLALPASDMYYGADYGMYHSIYENFHWMKTVVDPDFGYHRFMAELQGRVALRLANADVLPLDFGEEARYWRLAYEDLERSADASGRAVPRLGEATALIERWQQEAEALERQISIFLADPHAIEDSGLLSELNTRLARAPRDFFRRDGRPGAMTERNLFAGSSYDFENVSGSTLPGIRFSLDRGDEPTAARESDLYLAVLARRVAGIRSLRRLLEEGR